MAEYYQWMRQQGPELAAEAERWYADHPEEKKALDNAIYSSDQKHYRHYGGEVDETQLPQSMNPDDYLPEDVKDRIYDDKDWFVRDKYLPEGVDKATALYLYKDVILGLQNLTELQREVIFRNVINGESVHSIAKEKNCTDRNIRSIRDRALKMLRGSIKDDCRGTMSITVLLITIFAFIAINATSIYFAYLADTVLWFQAFCRAITPLTIAGAWLWFRHVFHAADRRRVRNYWRWLHGN